ncbi:acyl-CoA N-acyltransferase, partial [Aureobasidium melanogenum]
MSEADLIHNFSETLNGLKTKMSTSDSEAGQRAFVAYDTDTPADPSDLVFPEAWEHKAEVELSEEEKKNAKKVVGVAIWVLQPSARTQEQIDKEAEEDGPHAHAPGANGALLDAMDAAMTASKKKWIGLEPYLYLRILAIDPAYQRRGVGSLLLDEGLAVADRCGIQAYLEATKVGRPLYARYGFKDCEFMDFDVVKYAPTAKDDPPHEFMVMVRPAGAKKYQNLITMTFPLSYGPKSDITAERVACHLNAEPNLPGAEDLDLELITKWIVALKLDLRPKEIKRLAPKVLDELRAMDGITAEEAARYQQRYPIKRDDPVLVYVWGSGGTQEVKLEETPDLEKTSDQQRSAWDVVGKKKATKQEDPEQTAIDAAVATKKAKKAAKKARKAARTLENAKPPVGKKEEDSEDDGNDSDWTQTSWSPSWASDSERDEK